MSTKTTFKRIALVAVAALGFGTLSVAPSNAYNVEASFRALSWAATPSATGTTAVEWSAVVKVTGSCGEFGAGPDNVFATTTAQLDSAPVGSNLLLNTPTWSTGTPTGYTNTNATAAVAAFANEATGYKKATQVSCSSATSALVGYSTVKFTPDKVGTYTIVLLPLGSTTGSITQTITVAAPVVRSVKAYLNTDTTTATTADATSLVYAAASNVTAKGAVVVQQYSTTDTTTVATTAIAGEVKVEITKGLVSKTNDFFAGAKSVTTAAGATNGRSEYYVFANGEVGSATLTVTVGALTSTKTITFKGVAATLSAALTSGQPTFIAPLGTTTVTVTAKDSAANATDLPTTLTATPASTAIATATVSSGVVTITGVAAGTTVITIADSATTAPATSATYSVTVAPAAAVALPTLTFDKAEYAAGELMTITIGALAADNASFAAFTAAPATSLSLVTVKNPFTSGAVALVGGKATWTAYAPITPGPITVTATSSTGSAATAATVTATATVISNGVAEAAVDAANEAIDAANAATDAANAAAEAADAATAAAQDAADAVAALAVSVEAMINSLKKQITALTNLVIKIQKKVKA